MLPYQILMSTITGEKIKKSCKSYKLKISAQTQNKKSELPYESYPVLDISDY